MIYETIKYSLDDLTIIPAHISQIKSRNECDIYDSVNNYLPIFTAPMIGVVNEHNAHIFEENKINTIIPRTVKYDTRINFLNSGYWVAFSLKEFKNIFCENTKNILCDSVSKVCVDLANGHMRDLYDSINKAKELAEINHYTLIIMTGNIANPHTYRWICENAKVDYIRIGIGTGSNCITSSNTATHYPMASLINECLLIKKELKANRLYQKSMPFIIADGGMHNYNDVIKALALGADYVMIGSLFTSFLESAGEIKMIEMYDNEHYPAKFDNRTGTISYYTNYLSNYTTKSINIWNGSSEEEKREFLRSVKQMLKKTIGMSTKEAQLAMAAAKETPEDLSHDAMKTSEGITKSVQCKYTLAQWVNNMKDYLRSAMSYTGKKTLNEFKSGDVILVRNSVAAINAVNK